MLFRSGGSLPGDVYSLIEGGRSPCIAARHGQSSWVPGRVNSALHLQLPSDPGLPRRPSQVQDCRGLAVRTFPEGALWRGWPPTQEQRGGGCFLGQCGRGLVPWYLACGRGQVGAKGRQDSWNLPLPNCPPAPQAAGPARGPSSLLTPEAEMVVCLLDGCWGPTKPWYVVVT